MKNETHSNNKTFTHSHYVSPSDFSYRSKDKDKSYSRSRVRIFIYWGSDSKGTTNIYHILNSKYHEKYEQV